MGAWTQQRACGARAPWGGLERDAVLWGRKLCRLTWRPAAARLRRPGAAIATRTGVGCCSSPCPAASLQKKTRNFKKKLASGFCCAPVMP